MKWTIGRTVDFNIHVALSSLGMVVAVLQHYFRIALWSVVAFKGCEVLDAILLPSGTAYYNCIPSDDIPLSVEVA